MSVAQLLPPRSFAFGSLGADGPDGRVGPEGPGGLWGACWLRQPVDGGRRWPAGGPTHRLALGTERGPATVEVSVSDGGPDEPWQVTGDGIELTLTPAAAPALIPGAAVGATDSDQVCQIEGRLEAAGTTVELACLGWRGSGGPLEEAGRVESFRQLAAWFAPGEGLALLAVRPHSAKGQDKDVITAVTLDPDRTQAVADPRLSTTYDATGAPRRAGLELWLDAPPDPDGGVAEGQHSRRAAGAAVAGQPVQWELGALELSAQLFRWHSAGRDGAGVYLTGTLR